MNKHWIPAILVIASLALAACQPAAAAPTSAQPAAVSQGVIVQWRVVPLNSIDLAFSVGGRVVEVLAAEGEPVEAGQVIARLGGYEARLAELARASQEKDAADRALKDLEQAAELNSAQAQIQVIDAQKEVDNLAEKLDDLKAQYKPEQKDLDEAQARLTLAEVKLRMAQDHAAALVEGVDPDAYTAAKFRLDVAETTVTAAQAAVDALELRAPLAGTLVSMDIQVGQFVSPGQVVGTVADFSAWRIETDDLTELEVVRVKVGEAAGVILDAMPDKAMNAEVTHISQRFEEKRGDVTYTVTLALRDAADGLRWGMTGQISFAEGE